MCHMFVYVFGWQGLCPAFCCRDRAELRRKLMTWNVLKPPSKNALDQTQSAGAGPPLPLYFACALRCCRSSAGKCQYWQVVFWVKGLTVSGQKPKFVYVR